MSKETAKKLITEMQTNDELRAKTAGITDKDELLKMAKEAGFDVTLEELTEAEREYRAELAAKTDELTADELESVAGGKLWFGEKRSSDGKEYGCSACDLNYDDQEANGDWCKENYYCSSGYKSHTGRSTRKIMP